VKADDTLSKIAKEQLGDANTHQEILNANRDQLTDPDKIKPGQALKIPAMAKYAVCCAVKIGTQSRRRLNHRLVRRSLPLRRRRVTAPVKGEKQWIG
jgi:LysM repeat protein